MRYALSQPLLLALALLALPDRAPAQERLGARPWAQWGPTYWNILTVRMKCDGATPFSGPTPTRWRVDIKNGAAETVYLDYVIVVTDDPTPVKPRRVSINPGKIRQVYQEVDTDCGGSVTTRISRVRVGGDGERVPFLPPDDPRGRLEGT